MSDSGEPTPLSHEWQYKKKEVVTPKDFLRDILSKLQAAELCSFGEYHDERIDQSYSFLLQHQTEILEIYDWLRFFKKSL